MTQPTRTANLRLGDSESSHLANGPLAPLALKAVEADLARTLLLPLPPWEEPVTAIQIKTSREHTR